MLSAWCVQDPFCNQSLNVPFTAGLEILSALTPQYLDNSRTLHCIEISLSFSAALIWRFSLGVLPARPRRQFSAARQVSRCTWHCLLPLGMSWALPSGSSAILRSAEGTGCSLHLAIQKEGADLPCRWYENIF